MLLSCLRIFVCFIAENKCTNAVSAQVSVVGDETARDVIGAALQQHRDEGRQPGLSYDEPDRYELRPYPDDGSDEVRHLSVLPTSSSRPFCHVLLLFYWLFFSSVSA